MKVSQSSVGTHDHAVNPPNARRWLGGLVGAALLALAAPSHAGTVIASFIGPNPAGGVVQRTILTGPGAPQIDSTQDPERFDMLRTGGTSLATLVGSGVGTDFYGFCIEPRQFLASPATSYDLVTLSQGTTNLGGMGAVKADEITELFGRYAPNLGAPMTSLQAGALQIAIWEIVRELPGNPLDVTTGNISFTGPENPSGMIALAQSYVQSLDGTGPRAVGLAALNNGIYGDPATDAGTQDMLVQMQVPEPATLSVLALGSLGLAGARMVRRRRR
jgi:hypothetical protein